MPLRLSGAMLGVLVASMCVCWVPAGCMPGRVAVDVNARGRLIRMEGFSTMQEDEVHDLRFSADAIASQSSSSRRDVTRCYEPVSAMDTSFDQKCPDDCPYWAENVAAGVTCQFKCVNGSECGESKLGLDASEDISDGTNLFCRSCQVGGCKTCSDELEDKCAECQLGYFLQDGLCISTWANTKFVVLAVLCAIFLYLLLWWIELLCRPVVNDEGVQVGLAHRSRTKLRMPVIPKGAGAASAASASGTAAAATSLPEPSGGEGSGQSTPPVGSRPLWPLTTNLLKEPAAGPGTTLMFNFQCGVILWAFLALTIWLIVALSGKPDLLKLGLEDTPTPRHLCRVIMVGHDLQYKSMWVKILFILLFYLLTFFGSIAFAVFQLRRFQVMDEKTTMKDFAAMCEGLPRLKGSEAVEEVLSKLFATETGQKVVGVSVCWDFAAREAEVFEAVEVELDQRNATATRSDKASSKPPDPPAKPTPTESSGSADAPQSADQPLIEAATLSVAQRGGLRWKLFGILDRFFGFGVRSETKEGKEDDPKPEEGKEGDDAKKAGTAQEGKKESSKTEVKTEMEKTRDLVSSMESTECAFVVFETELARDAAVAMFSRKSPPVQLEGNKLQLRSMEAEPDTVRWESFGVAPERIPRRLALGMLVILGALSLWIILFYVPYILYVSSFSYEGDEAPAGWLALALSFVVVGGNLWMYCVCNIVSGKVGFRFEDEREAAYMMLYCLAVSFNVVLDMAVAGWVSYKTMVGLGAPTYDGQKLASVKSFQAIVESYPIQKALGFQLFYYAFPSCFLAPFMVEPFINNALPLHFCKLLVRSHHDVKGREAEKSLQPSAPMDMARYADIIINVTLTVLMLFVPGGYWLKTFLALFGSHIVLFILDHYKVLRLVPTFCYANKTIDSFAMKLMAVPCGLILTALVFKANCASGSGLCLKGNWLVLVCIDAFVLHLVVHWAILAWVVPSFGLKDHSRSTSTYAETAARLPRSWFSTNPVHCLRSQRFFKHSPPWCYYKPGKEHLMKKNPAIGAHFEDEPAEPEQF